MITYILTRKKGNTTIQLSKHTIKVVVELIMQKEIMFNFFPSFFLSGHRFESACSSSPQIRCY
jgi:hypothetical protein